MGELKPEKLSGEWVGYQEAIAWAQTRDGSFAVAMSQASSTRLAAALGVRADIDDCPLALKSPNARAQILSGLRSGALLCRGVNDESPSLRRQDISTADWAGLRISEKRGGTVAEELPGHRSLKWHSLLFEAQRLISMFPPLTPDEADRLKELNSQKPRASDADVRRACKGIIDEWIAAGQQGDERPKVRSVVARVKDEVPRSTKSQIEAMWKEARSAVKGVSWETTGRRSKQYG